jgi:hypothetical protein
LICVLMFREEYIEQNIDKLMGIKTSTSMVT